MKYKKAYNVTCFMKFHTWNDIPDQKHVSWNKSSKQGCITMNYLLKAVVVIMFNKNKQFNETID